MAARQRDRRGRHRAVPAEPRRRLLVVDRAPRRRSRRGGRMSMTVVAQRLPTSARRPATHRTNIAQQSWIMVKRNMIHTKRMPEMLSDVTVQPIMFVLLFAFVFGASIATSGSASYREFLLPGIQAQTIVFTAFVVSTGITADIEKGIIDRFRSLP